MNNETITLTDHITKIGEEFNYIRCERCGSLSIMAVPVDMGQYYGENYYSYQWNEDKPIELGKFYCATHLIEACKLTEKSKVLDWGCGTGELLHAFYERGVGEAGKTHLLRGYEPFSEPVTYKNGIKVQNTIPNDTKFTLVISNHSLEHTPDFTAELKKIYECVEEGGYVYIGLPVLDCFCFGYFREHYANLDAPRHLAIPTVNAIKEAVTSVGFKDIKAVTEQTEWGLYFSVGYQSGRLYKEMVGETPEEEKRSVVESGSRFLTALQLGDTISIIARK